MQEALSHFAAAPWVAAIALAVVFAGAVVQFSLGMGFGLTVAPVLALLDPALVPVPALIMSFAVALGGALREARAIRWPAVALAAGGRGAGALAAAVVLGGIASDKGFSLIFGLLITGAVALSLAGLRLAFTRRNILAMGAVSGVMATITSVGAPPLAMVFQSRPANEARPTLSAIFTFGTLFSLAGLWLSGWAGMSDLWLALLLSPAALAGFLAARALGPRLDARYRTALLGISGLAGVALILRGLL
ncbi:TSUP family transporter [Salipiger sp. P9]|uniref:TSUP family transporter n=1 Tax=Salipiger pentaromativorans TaxID=2943193 RepID=UPI0021589E3D|nr:TSUP family transporter [Salipiger pentaromativorans]